MEPFLKLVVNYIHTHYKDRLENLCIVLPSKRGAVYLKGYFAQIFKETIWLPEIKSAEDFIEELSGLKHADEIELIAMLYDSYLACLKNDPDSFDKFSKWGHLMLQDFNEIDRYLVDSNQIYTNLQNIKEIENWSLGETDLTITQQNYLAFMASIGNIYKHFKEQLLVKGIAYQGLIYRVASERFKERKELDNYHKILFCGFNALNSAETIIYKYLHTTQKADFLWDADTYYLNNDLQEAGIFLRNNFETFPTANPLFISSGFKELKTIQVTAVAGQIGQAQLVHDRLKALLKENRDLSKVAIVLANEKLLWPLLKLLPPEIEHVNITMEYPIRYTQAFSFIELVLKIQMNFDFQSKKSSSVYHKDFIAFINHAFFGVLLKACQIKLDVQAIVNQVRDNNMAFISQTYIHEKLNKLPTSVINLIKPWTDGNEGNTFLQEVTSMVREYYIDLFTKEIIQLEIEYLEVLHKSFKRLSDVLKKHPHYLSFRSYRQLFLQTVGSASVPFLGEPLRGLQIMGVLETRTLDFEEVIMVGVNEGVLPSGKSMNSFLPNDLKRVFGLPLYYEKDAIYAYHFYRLLQRCKNAHLIYDSETDEMGKGEKSRFITQLQYELKQYESSHTLTENVAISVSPEYEVQTISIEKTDTTLHEIMERAINEGVYGGLSPSALISFKDCSLRYYFRYGAGIKEIKDVEENAEAGTFGTILHKALEVLYTPFLNKPLVSDDFKRIYLQQEIAVEKAFKEELKDANTLKGKAVLQLEVLKFYVKKQIQRDEQLVDDLKKKNQYLTLLFLEKEWQAPLDVMINGVLVKLNIKGKIDRIDKCGDSIRVLDYKTSVKSTDKFKFTDYQTLFSDTDYNKQFQLFCYIWLLNYNMPAYLEKAVPGIIPFKKQLDEPLKITIQEDKRPSGYHFNNDNIMAFEVALKEFIAGIFNKETPFQQTKDVKSCEYCDYKNICMR